MLTIQRKAIEAELRRLMLERSKQQHIELVRQMIREANNAKAPV